MESDDGDGQGRKLTQSGRHMAGVLSQIKLDSDGEEEEDDNGSDVDLDEMASKVPPPPLGSLLNASTVHAPEVPLPAYPPPPPPAHMHTHTHTYTHTPFQTTPPLPYRRDNIHDGKLKYSEAYCHSFLIVSCHAHFSHLANELPLAFRFDLQWSIPRTLRPRSRSSQSSGEPPAAARPPPSPASHRCQRQG